MKGTQVLTEAFVELPIEKVWAVIADTKNYREWNKLFWFEGEPFLEGEKTKLGIAAGPLKTSVSVTVEVFREQNELRWVANAGPIRGSHFFKVAQVSDTRTQILHGEDFEGLGLIWRHVRHDVRASYQRILDGLVYQIESLNA